MEWLVKRVPRNNGRIGMLGVSYDGWLVVQALMDPHPAFKAASPQASPADMWMGDDFHHQGAFRLSYGFEYAYEMEHSKDFSAVFPFGRADTYNWYLELGGLARVKQEVFKGAIPTWNDYVAHPDYDEFWKKQAAVPYLNQPVTVPTLNVAGWWDQEDFYGPVTIYREMEKHDASNLNFLVVGPWNHGGWGGTGRALGAIDFGANTADWYRAEVQRPFFACNLKGAATGCHPAEATLFRGGDNKWVTSTTFPRRDGVTPTAIYPSANGAISFTRPSAAGRFWCRRVRGLGILSSSGDLTDLRTGITVAHVARRRPAVRRTPARRAELGDGSAGKARHHQRGDRGDAVRLYQWQRRRLDRQADRRVPRLARAGEVWLRIDGGERCASRSVSRILLEAACAGTREGGKIWRGPAHAGVHFRDRPPNHDSDSEYLVSDY
jgi:hypothetical protein